MDFLALKYYLDHFTFSSTLKLQYKDIWLWPSQDIIKFEVSKAKCVFFKYTILVPNLTKHFSDTYLGPLLFEYYILEYLVQY